jgi:hypothetical protein
VIDALRDEWLTVALATGPTDRLAAEAGVRTAYEQAGLRLRTPSSGSTLRCMPPTR